MNNGSVEVMRRISIKVGQSGNETGCKSLSLH